MTSVSPWRTTPRKAIVIFLLAVFFTFASFGFVSDAIDLGRQPLIRFVLGVVLSGLFAVAYAATGTALRDQWWKACIPIFVVQFFLMGSLVRWFPDAPQPRKLGAADFGTAAVVLAYFFYDVARIRIDGFLFSQGDNYQVESALRTLTGGGLFGAGPGAGTRKFLLPEPHTDYIFSVIGEEFGIIACVAIAILYMTIVVRVLVRLLNEEDKFLVLATAGLVTQFGLQALINMAVNVHIAPSKGMTLPFISYGGSSLFAVALTMGFALAVTRQRPQLAQREQSLFEALGARA